MRHYLITIFTLTALAMGCKPSAPNDPTSPDDEASAPNDPTSPDDEASARSDPTLPGQEDSAPSHATSSDEQASSLVRAYVAALNARSKAKIVPLVPSAAVLHELCPILGLFPFASALQEATWRDVLVAQGIEGAFEIVRVEPPRDMKQLVPGKDWPLYEPQALCSVTRPIELADAMVTLRLTTQAERTEKMPLPLARIDGRWYLAGYFRSFDPVQSALRTYTPCDRMLESAGQEAEAIQTAVGDFVGRKPKKSALQEIQEKDVKTFEEVDAALASRKENWLAYQREGEGLQKRISANWNAFREAKKECDKEEGYDDVAWSHDYRVGRFREADGVREALLEATTIAECSAESEAIATYGQLLMNTRLSSGIDKNLHDIAVKHGFNNPNALRGTIYAACATFKLSSKEKIPEIAQFNEAAVAQLAEVYKSVVWLYETFVMNPPDAAKLAVHNQNFVELAIFEARHGRELSLVTLMNEGNHRMPLNAADREKGTTLLMAVTLTGKTALLKELSDYARRTPARGPLGVDQRDKGGATALSYCVASKNCKADLMQFLLVDLKADKRIKNNSRQTPLDEAKTYQRTDLIPLLED